MLTSDRMQNAEVVVPWSMVVTTILNGALGFAIIIAVLFVTTGTQFQISRHPSIP